MRYAVTVTGRTFLVELGTRGITLDGQPIPADLATLPGTPIRHLLAPGSAYTLTAQPATQPGTWTLQLPGARLTAHVLDERAHTLQRLAAHSAKRTGPAHVRAPMPGLVLRVEVQPGQTVRPGQGLLIIEAMKMENELRADTAGTVARILVQAGQPVDKGALLIELDPLTTHLETTGDGRG